MKKLCKLSSEWLYFHEIPFLNFETAKKITESFNWVSFRNSCLKAWCHRPEKKHLVQSQRKAAIIDLITSTLPANLKIVESGEMCHKNVKQAVWLWVTEELGVEIQGRHNRRWELLKKDVRMEWYIGGWDNSFHLHLFIGLSKRHDKSSRMGPEDWEKTDWEIKF